MRFPLSRFGARDGQDGRSPEIRRREFLTLVSLGLGALGAALVGVPVVTALFVPQIQEEPNVWRDIGPENEFTVGDTVLVTYQDSSSKPYAGETATDAAYLRRTGDNSFICFSIHCTHLGCPVRWLPDANLFMCPCHGGVFYADGSVASGPPPVPLNLHPVRIQNGVVQIETQPLPIT